MGFEEDTSEDDQVFQLDDLTVICDRDSLSLLSGLRVDFSSQLLGGGFKFHNPNASRSCGCGSSFGV